MKFARALAYPLLLLLALWIPKIVVARLYDGYAVYSPTQGFEADVPYFWHGWFASLVLMVLVHGWSLRGTEKYLTVRMLLSVSAALALQAFVAPHAHVLNNDTVAIDAIALFCSGLITACLILCWRSIRKDRTAPNKEDGWGQWIVYVAQWLLWAFGSFAAMVLLSSAFEPNHIAVVLAWSALFLLFVMTVLLHEGGHYLGARLSGMKVLVMRVMAVECYPRRGRWLIRWAPKANHRYRGYVYAVPDLDRPMRPQMLWMIVMGPMANAVVCLVSLPLALTTSTPWLEGTSAAFAVINGVMAIGNLLPRTGSVNSDGARLLQWLHRQDDQGPEFAYMRLQSRSAFGTTADALPEADIHYLENRPMPVPLLAMWYRLKAAQNRTDWDGALQVGDRFEQMLSTWSHPKTELESLIALIRAEVAFSHAMATGKPDALSESLVTKDVRQLCPHFWPRCLALKAFLVGAEEDAKRLLQQAMDEASRSVDLALAKSEAMLARYIMESKQS
ncbi:MAG TPA: M50 family metallopeptidase [Candidatus Saccharimonadales bacterium]|nr:M50 family metallopeptidase [Candidatus Saccharimonadales bacterium]